MNKRTTSATSSGGGNNSAAVLAETSLSPRALTVLLLSTILPLLDSSLVNVLVPSISHSLHSDPAQIQYGISGYMFAATIGIIISTTTMRRFGSRRVWAVAVGAFGLSSLAVALSPHVAVFIATRCIQGLACGVIMPSVQMLAVEAVGKSGMKAALASIGLPAVLAPALGPLLGGTLVEFVGWRVLFVVNLPIALIALVLAKNTFAPSEPQQCPLGIGQIVPAAISGTTALWALTSLGSQNWPLAGALFAVSVLACFVFYRSDIRSTHPLLDMELYHEIPFASTMLLCLIAGATFYGTLLATALHVQIELHQPSWVAGLILAAQGGGAWMSRKAIKGKLAAVNSFTIIAGGLVIAAITTVALQSFGHFSTPAFIGMILLATARGIGLGGCTLLILSAAYEVPDAVKAPAIGAHTRLMLQFGGALGTAAAGIWANAETTLGISIALFASIGATIAVLLWRYTTRASVNSNNPAG